MKRLSIITTQFYRLLLLYNIAFTLLTTTLFYFNAGAIDAPTFVFAKIAGFAAAVSLHYYSAKETYFYFRNAGYRVKQIVLSAFVIDIAVCTLIIMLFKIILYAAAHIKG